MEPILLFPGQSSRRPGMLRSAVALCPEATEPVLRRACEILGRDLLENDSQARVCNRDIQVGVFVASHLHLTALQAHGVRARGSAGLSLGEYNHLLHIGAIDFFDALRAVDARGCAYDAGPEGCMAAVFPVGAEELQEVLDGLGGAVAISNFNSPTQQVVAGERGAVEAALTVLADTLFVDGRIIEDRVPMHSPWFRPVAEVLAPALAATPFRTPERPYLPNVLGRAVDAPTPADIVELLLRHVYEPVQWQRTIEALAALGAPLVEVGPGTVLHDLLQRSWFRGVRGHTADADALREVARA